MNFKKYHVKNIIYKGYNISLIISKMPIYCKHKECEKVAWYNYQNEQIPIYCRKHKSENMIVMYQRRCQFKGCTKRSTFALPGEKSKFCAEHKENGMINDTYRIRRIHNSCRANGCEKIPVFNFATEKRGKYCKEHKLENMVNVKDKHCQHENCTTRPSFGFPNTRTSLFCFAHKKEGMIQLHCDYCQHEGCTIQASYGFPNGKRQFCTEHKEENMIHLHSNKCEFEECPLIPNFNFEGETKGRFCLSHKDEEMIDVVSPKCKTPLCGKIVGTKHKGYCLRCFFHLFPDEPVYRNYKTKEKAIGDFIKKIFNKYLWTFDKKIKGGSSNRRPDIFLNLGSCIIVIEVDENQHVNYDTICENRRLMEISLDVGHKPIIFIRFNPDDYISDDEKIASCWEINKLGVCRVPKHKEKEWGERLNTLKTTVEYCIKNKTTKTIEVVHLFYDE
jgi:hypothetical protein